MDTVNALLDRARKARGIESDNALAKVLGVGRAAVSRWRHGLSAPDPVSCAKLADMTGEPLAKVLGIVGEARAVSAAEKQVWRRLAEAAVLALALLPTASRAEVGNARNPLNAGGNSVGMHIMFRRIRTAFGSRGTVTQRTARWSALTNGWAPA